MFELNLQAELGGVCVVTLSRDRILGSVAGHQRTLPGDTPGSRQMLWQRLNLKANKELLPSGHATTLPITQASSWRCRMSCRIWSAWSLDTTRAAPTPQLKVLAISSSESCPSCCNHEKTLGIFQVQASQNKQELPDYSIVPYREYKNKS